MPRLSLTMKTGSVVQWFKKEGERVEKGEPVVEVLSEKVTYDVEAPAAGVLRSILAEEGVDVPVGATLAVIGSPDEELPAVDVEAPATARPDEAIIVAEPEAAQARERFLASPAAKRVAKEHDVDLAQVRGTGPEGRIAEEDVRTFLEQSTSTPRVKEERPLAGVRKTTAERVAASFRTAPHSYITMDVDMTCAAAVREKLHASYTALLIYATAQALQEHPTVNSTLVNGSVRIYESVNIGVAVSTEGGLVVPVIPDAERKPPERISTELEELAKKAREGKLTKKQLTGGTFTVTNLGMYHVDMFLPIINPPEAAILAAGRIVNKPVAFEGEVTVRPIMALTLAYDHRILDGVPAAEFLGKVKKKIESIA